MIAYLSMEDRWKLVQESRKSEPKSDLFKEWEKYFKEYLEEYPEDIGKIYMGCLPCYYKVFQFIKRKEEKKKLKQREL